MANTKLVTTITSPIKFLGCSVLDFNGSLGWGVDSSSFSVSLVEDCAAGDRFWGRDLEIIGAATVFDLSNWGSNFYYGGIINGWKQSRGSSGEKFSVTLEDAKGLLSGVTVICDSYSYAPVMEYNYYNVLAKWEGLVHLGNCSDFGSAESDPRGMNYNKIIAGLLAIAQQNQGDASQRPLVYSPTYGTAGTSNTVFKLDLGLQWNYSTQQLIQLRPDSLPIGPSYYKIAGSTTILDLINNICELTGRNFYTSLSLNELGEYVIKVHCVHLIDTYAGNYSTIVNAFDGIATELSYGKEFNNMKSRNMIMGDKISYLNSTSEFTYYFGDYTIDYPNTPIVPSMNADGSWQQLPGSTSDCGFWFNPELYILNAGLFTPLGVNYAWISEADLQAASASYPLWLTRATLAVKNPNDPNDPTKYPDTTVNPPGSLNYAICQLYPQLLNLTGSILTNLLQVHQNNSNFPIADIVNNIKGGQQITNASEKLTIDLESIYAFVKNFADNYYGKKFLYKINERICYTYADTTLSQGEIKFSSYPTNEGGWAEYGSNLLGLSDPYLAYFRADDGRVNCFALYGGSWASNPTGQDIEGYNGILDIKDLPEGDYITNGSNVWLRGTLGDKMYSVYDASLGYYVPASVIEFGSQTLIRPDPQYILGDETEQILTCLKLLANNSQLGGSDSNGNNAVYALGNPVIQNAGSSYVVGDFVSFNGGGTGQVAGIDGNGGVTSINITNPFVDSAGPRNFSISSTNGNGCSGYAKAAINERSKFCGIPSLRSFGVKTAGGRVANPDLNKLGVIRAATRPSAAIIPMKSNVVIYGPYFSNNFLTSYGGVNAEQDTGLVPWNFGSLYNMYLAGIARANTNLGGQNEVPLFISENGNVTVPGLPEYSLAGRIFLNGVYAGPLVNNVNVSFGSNGITTSYDFKTFSRKFGGLTAIQNDQIQQINQNRQGQLKYIRDNLVTASQIYKKSASYRLGGNQRLITNSNHQSSSRGNTTSRVFVGEMYNWNFIEYNPYVDANTYSQRTVVASESLDKLGAEAGKEYYKKAVMSFDGLFSPVSISGANGYLPRYTQIYTRPSGQLQYSLQGAQPPIAIGSACTDGIPSGDYAYSVRIDRYTLNPLIASGVAPNHKEENPFGHSIDIVGRGYNIDDEGMMTSFMTGSGAVTDEHRFISHKGPMVLHGWGYDTDGKPIPNRADSEANAMQGYWPGTGLQDYFLKDWLQKPATWPVGPIDLRFDKRRGVWVSAQPYKIVTAKVLEKIAPGGQGKATLFQTGRPLFDKDGEALANGKTCTEQEGDRNENPSRGWVIISAGAAPSTTPVPTPTQTPYPTVTPTIGPTPTGTPLPTPSGTPTPTPSGTPTPTPSGTPTPTPSGTPTPTPTGVTPTPTPTQSGPLPGTPCDLGCGVSLEVVTDVYLGSGGLIIDKASIMVLSGSYSASTSIPTTDCAPPVTPEPTPTVTVTPTPTATPTPTGVTPTPTPTGVTPTPTPTGVTPTPTPTGVTPTPTPTGVTPTPTPTGVTPTPTPTGVTPTPTPTGVTPTPTGVTPTPTPTPTSTPVPSGEPYIVVQDYLGRCLVAGTKIYAYYDADHEVYIALQEYEEPRTQLIYGTYTQTTTDGGYVSVEGYAGTNCNVGVGSLVGVTDPMNVTSSGSLRRVTASYMYLE